MSNLQTIPPQPGITPAAAVKILASNGLHVSEEKAGELLQFLYNLASSTLKAK